MQLEGADSKHCNIAVFLLNILVNDDHRFELI